jgi:hypothetical protein
MAERRHRLTPALGQQICAYIRAGGYPAVAAEAAGIPVPVFRRWLARGMKQGARQPYRSFAEAVRQAQAQARLGAEMAGHKKDGLTWLKCGPGREAGSAPGWTQPLRAAPAEQREEDVLRRPEVARLIKVLLDALTPHPEARAAAAAALEACQQRPKSDPPPQ